MVLLAVAALALAGLVVGPLLGIAADRTVDRLRPAAEHRCAHCETSLGPSSLVPIASWRQRCSGCGRHKGWRYPAVDIGTAVVFACLGGRFVEADPSGLQVDWKLWPFLAVGAVLVVLTVIDIETHLLPNVILWPAIATGAFAVMVLSGELDDGTSIGPALFGAAVFGGSIGLAHVIYEPGMGRGDVKLALFLGIFVGWITTDYIGAMQLVFYAILVSMLLGGFGGLAYNAVRRRGRAEIPFGPALVAGSLAVIVGSPAIVGS